MQNSGSIVEKIILFLAGLLIIWGIIWLIFSVQNQTKKSSEPASKSKENSSSESSESEVSDDSLDTSTENSSGSSSQNNSSQENIPF